MFVLFLALLHYYLLNDCFILADNFINYWTGDAILTEGDFGLLLVNYWILLGDMCLDVF